MLTRKEIVRFDYVSQKRDHVPIALVREYACAGRIGFSPCICALRCAASRPSVTFRLHELIRLRRRRIWISVGTPQSRMCAPKRVRACARRAFLDMCSASGAGFHQPLLR
jgi:hypothetical protein